ncbi:hypothetical protein BaRGS_00021102, partial [Batillaria attramentaria]
VCHHPQCTEDNKDLPLLLCRQCDVDIHRNPGYSGHLVLDVSGKQSDSGDDSHHDEDVVDGRQLFVKKPSKDYRRNRSPSEVERKLKRKKAVKKKSFSKNDSQTYGLEAALAQIACPEGPDLMANLTAETEGEGSRESSDLARKDSTSEPSLVSQQESIESSPHDPGLPPHPRTPIRRQSRLLKFDCHSGVRTPLLKSEDWSGIRDIVDSGLARQLRKVPNRPGGDRRSSVTVHAPELIAPWAFLRSRNLFRLSISTLLLSNVEQNATLTGYFAVSGSFFAQQNSQTAPEAGREPPA